MTFKGKIDKYWYVIIGVLNGITIAAILYQGFTSTILMTTPIWILVNLYFIPVLFRNEVVIDKKNVVVRFGLLTKTIPIANISTLREMKEHSASFAASFKRVEICSKRMSTVYIAVEDRGEFIQKLMKANRKIKYVV